MTNPKRESIQLTGDANWTAEIMGMNMLKDQEYYLMTKKGRQWVERLDRKNTAL